jgi:hypothetical protein
MRLVRPFAIAVALACLMPAVPGAQMGGDPDRVVPNGGISVAGWQGKIDPGSVTQGRTINDSKFSQEGNALHLIIGPAAVYWNPANTASGDYTIKGTFKEPKMSDANSHPHPYGIFIGGHNMGTDKMSLVYCLAYGDGRALVRGFNPTAGPPTGAQHGVFTPMRAAANAAVKKVAAGEPVTQDISWTVKGDSASCTINGTVVATYTKADLVGADKLESFDGVYGIRISHNVEAVVTGFGKQ